MSAWRHWWRWWLASYAQRPGTRAEADAERERDDELPSGATAAFMNNPGAAHPANQPRLATGARRLQRQIGNRGVRLLAEQPGEPLASALRTELRPTQSDDLSDVRLHTGAAGAEIARAAGADAVAIGRDVAFRDGMYSPSTPQGRELLRHELAHTAQSGAGQGRDPAQLERAARAGSPGQAVAAPGEALRQPRQSWQERVTAAKAETDARARRTAMIALIREALAGYTVNIAPETPSTGPVATAQYAAAPAINFDFYLEQKDYWPGAGRSGRLGPRTGYFFSDRNTGYAIIGPSALETSSSALTKMHADHELFHAAHHMSGTASRDDQELQAWTDAVVHYFHQVYQARKSWGPLITYYEGSSAGAKTAALTALVNYFNSQPADIQKAMLEWLRRRQSDMGDKLLVQHLAARIVPAAPAPTPAPRPAPPP